MFGKQSQKLLVVFVLKLLFKKQTRIMYLNVQLNCKAKTIMQKSNQLMNDSVIKNMRKGIVKNRCQTL